jgi:WD40 repeat protein
LILEGHSAAVTAVAFSPHAAHHLISAGEDRTFKLWDLVGWCRLTSV